ncbi:TlpA family protein disulfide reductase [Robertkochia flava]|uniref:TlpA family protein disulfide reductase n=1 Tax=Robertkochia flava TaxID=3447986 RepID=UPI001CCF4B90|nr:TlpA disulfide reductase family protein [Robertkochia marina]
MKRSMLLLVLLGMASCQDNKQPQHTLLSGEVRNTQEKLAVLMNNDRSYRDTIPLGENGKFSDTLEVDPGHYMLYIGKNATPLYMERGNDIAVKMDGADALNTTQISGKGAAISNYLVAKQRLYKDYMKQTSSLYTLEEAAFLKKLDTMKTEQMEVLHTAGNIPETYRELEKRNISYYNLGLQQAYEGYHRYYTKKDSFKVSPAFNNALAELSFENEEDYDFSPYYRRLLLNHYNAEASKLTKEEPGSEFSENQLKVLLENKNPHIRSSMIYITAKGSMAYSSNLDRYYEKVMSQLRSEEHKKEITKLYNSWKKLEPGQPSPEFSDYENYAGGTTSLEDLRGKYVYIDVWATWCGPCRYEIPHLKKLEKDFHGRDIHFVSISIDEDKSYDQWRKMIEDESLGGIQLLADKQWKSNFVQDYMISGIPRFILIDPQGKVVDNNADRPSSETIRILFKELNI